MPVKIIECKSCKPHKYQDDKYSGKRVYNQTREQDGKVWRCTVCNGTKSFGDDKK